MRPISLQYRALLLENWRLYPFIICMNSSFYKDLNCLCCSNGIFYFVLLLFYLILLNIIIYLFCIINAKYWVEFKASSILGTCIIEVSCMPKPQKDPYVPGGLLSVIV